MSDVRDSEGADGVAALQAQVRALRIREAVERCGGTAIARDPKLVARLVGNDPRLLLDPDDASAPLNAVDVLGAVLAEFPYLMPPGSAPPPSPAAPLPPSSPITATPRPGRAN